MIAYLKYISGIYKPFFLIIFIFGFFLSILFLLLLIIFFYYFSRQKQQKKKDIFPPSANNVGSKIKLIKEDVFSLPPFLMGFSAFLSRYKYFQAGTLSQIFFKAHLFLKRTLPGSDYKYKLPWFLLIGPEQSGKTSISLSLERYMSSAIPDFHQPIPRSSCYWSFFNDGILLNLKGEFLIGKNDLNNNDEGWKSLLILLTRYRTAYPLNGIVLTFPIFEFCGKDALNTEVILERSYLIRQKIISAQTYIGLKLPIYILITKIDELPGFQEFIKALPPSKLQNPLGWSVPYNLEVDYSSDWFDEGFKAFSYDFKQLILDCLSHTSSDFVGGMYVFCQEILSIQERLKIYVDHIFLGANLNEKPYFRGFYFTGHNQNENVFIGNLFRQKIFYEKNLAKPFVSAIRQSELSISYLKYGTAFSCVLGALGLIHVRSNFQNQRDVLIPTVSKMAKLFDEMQMIQVSDDNKMRLIFEDTSEQLVNLVDNIKGALFFSPFVPATWFSKFRKELNQTLGLTTQMILIRSIYYHLLLRLRDILNMRPTQEDESDNLGGVLIPTQSSEFKLLRKFIFDLDELTINIQKFNNFNTAEDPHILNDLLEYSFHAKLPQKFIERYNRIDDYITNNVFIPLHSAFYDKEKTKTLSILYQKFYNALFDLNTDKSLVSHIKKIQRYFDPKDTSINLDLKYLYETNNSLNAVINIFGKPGETWLDGKYFNPDKNFTELMEKIQLIFGKKVAQYLIDQTAIGFDNLLKVLQMFTDFIQGQSLNRNIDENIKNPGQSPAQSILKLQEVLKEIFDQTYVISTESIAINSNLPIDDVCFWNIDMIKGIVLDIKSFHDFMGKTLNKFPFIMQFKAHKIMKDGLRNYVLSSLARAQIIEKKIKYTQSQEDLEANLRSKIILFKDLSSQFTEILQFLNDTSEGKEFLELRRLLSDTGMYLLRQIDQMLEKSDLYRIRKGDLSWWDGQKGLAFGAFAVIDGVALKNYLDIQMIFLEKMNGFAEPIVSFFKTSIMSEEENNKELINKWTLIVESIDQKKNGQPISSLNDLNLFIQNQLNDINIDNAEQIISIKSIHDVSSDFFKEKNRLIQKAILERVEVLIRKRSIDNYYALQDSFNSLLKGHFPFSGSSNTSKELLLEDLKSFLHLYEILGGFPEKLFDKVYQFEDIVLQNMIWLRNMYSVYTFFKPWMDGLQENPEFDLEIKFRVNRNQEKNAQYIVDMWFESNQSKRLSYAGQEVRKGIWSYGQPIKIGMRWAEGSDIPIPVGDPNQKNMSVSGKQVEFTFGGNWALLSLLNLQAIKNSGNKPEASYILKFDLPQEGEKTATVFIELQVKSNLKVSKSSEALKIPQFPQEVPALPDTIIQKYNNLPYLLENENHYAKPINTVSET